MKILKLSLLFVFGSLFCLSAFCQNPADADDADDDKDTSVQIVPINKMSAKKRGVYKTYEEYVNNSPSVEAEFKLNPLKISKNNPLIAEADVDYVGKRPKKIWGVCDGENVYIRVMVGQFFKNHYFKLQCDGPRPYIYYVENPVFLPLGAGVVVAATVAATSAALPPFVSLNLVRDETNYLKPVLAATQNWIRKYLSDYPDMLEAYNNEPKRNKATKVKYLTEYNNRKIEQR